MGKDVSGTSERPWSNSATTKEKKEKNSGQSKGSEMKDFECSIGIQFIEKMEGRSSIEVFNMDDVSPDKQVSQGEGGIVYDLMGHDDNFKYPWLILGEIAFPGLMIRCSRMKKNSTDCILTDPLGVEKLPPHSTIHKIEEEFRQKSNLEVKFPLYGNFDREGVRILKQFHPLKRFTRRCSFRRSSFRVLFQERIE